MSRSHKDRKKKRKPTGDVSRPAESMKDEARAIKHKKNKGKPSAKEWD